MARPGLRPALPRVVLMTDDRRLPDPRAAVCGLPRGAGVVFRHYGWPAAERERLGRALRALARARGLVFLVGCDGALATRLGADGLHLPEAMLARAAGWRRCRPGWLITGAVHGARALAAAARLRLDGVLLSPVWPSASHPGVAPLGPLRFAALAARAPTPVLALGGMDGGRLRRLAPARVHGFAAIAALSGHGASTQSVSAVSK